MAGGSEQPPAAVKNSPRRILVRGVNWLGDAVMSTPALLRLHERFPETHIALLTPEKLAGLWVHHPAIKEVLTFAPRTSVRAISQRLRQDPFDVALVFPNSIRAALEVWWARIPRRVGYRRPWRNWLLNQLLEDRTGVVPMHKRSIPEVKALIASAPAATPRSAPYTPHSHHLHHYLHLVAAIGADPAPLPPQLLVSGLELAALDTTLIKQGRLADFVVGLNPGAEYGPAKRWPVESFATAANELYRQISCEFLIFGGPNETALASRLEGLLRAPKANGHVQVLAGKTTLRELMASLRLCHVLITNDTGPMHVAAALGTPVVVPFGSTSPELTGPGLPGDTRHHFIQSDAPCSPCFLRECPIDFRCMRNITPALIVTEVLAVLRQSREPRRRL
jgi:heptosyltransferase-2